MVDDGVVHQSPVGEECQVIGFCGKCGNSSRASRNEGVFLIKWIPSTATDGLTVNGMYLGEGG